jgi:hypothetical protein
MPHTRHYLPLNTFPELTQPSPEFLAFDEQAVGPTGHDHEVLR